MKQALGADSGLTEGINVNKLKEKYQSQRGNIDVSEAMKIHKEALNSDLVEENYRDFEKEKYEDLEAALPS